MFRLPTTQGGLAKMVETVVHYRYLFDYSASIKLDTARK
jgi:hypothetical protein